MESSMSKLGRHCLAPGPNLLQLQDRKPLPFQPLLRSGSWSELPGAGHIVHDANALTLRLGGDLKLDHWKSLLLWLSGFFLFSLISDLKSGILISVAKETKKQTHKQAKKTYPVPSDLFWWLRVIRGISVAEPSCYPEIFSRLYLCCWTLCPFLFLSFPPSLFFLTSSLSCKILNISKSRKNKKYNGPPYTHHPG